LCKIVKNMKCFAFDVFENFAQLFCQIVQKIDRFTKTDATACELSSKGLTERRCDVFSLVRASNPRRHPKRRYQTTVKEASFMKRIWRV
jgi:hypothetical protein